MNRTAMMVNSGIFGAFFLYMAWRGPTSPRAYAVLSSLMVSFVPALIVTREDKFKAMALVASLPVSRRTVVLARYTLTLGVAVVGILLAMCLGSWLPGSQLDADVLMRPGPLLMALAVAMVLIGFLLPFTLRFGFMGLMIALVSFQVVGILLFVTVQATGSSMDNHIAERVLAGILELQARVGPAVFHFLLIGLLLAGVVVSCLISIRVFQEREL
jgi:hypothetical protein